MGNSVWGAGHHAGLGKGRNQGFAVGIAAGVTLGSAVLWSIGKFKDRSPRNVVSEASKTAPAEPLSTDRSPAEDAAGDVEGPTSRQDPGEEGTSS